MVRLYLLGFTRDLDGVVFGQRKGGKKASFWVPIDETFLGALTKLERARNQRDGVAPEPEAIPPAERVVLPAIGRSQSRIPASEIQQQLREGRSVETVAKAAKASKAWVERLAEPVMFERSGVVQLAQQAFMSRARLGPSGLPLGRAIALNLEERRATLNTLEGLDEGWDARATRTGAWRVRLKFNHRGTRRVAEWDFVKSTRQIAPRNRLGTELGWWPPVEEPKRAKLEPEPEEPTEAEPVKAAKSKRPTPARRKAAKRKPADRKHAKRKPARRKPLKRKPLRRKPSRRGPGAKRGKSRR